ncbi:uncharacterized protein B0H18DRAFT_245406 [Fomitopsis serialis]|uniref:uncharacterized protein n=1 Tax=Fomitopsis serialis TaxID=139415 RepID=UPI0020088964|nr:uncharacterized protein B0H18DRAFT_245406 [Neoantrodia serialis]KAH9928671.1 hypothetical protein B0H18DRAFT_245406 [Neoantrodia serialis]
MQLALSSLLYWPARCTGVSALWGRNSTRRSCTVGSDGATWYGQTSVKLFLAGVADLSTCRTTPTIQEVIPTGRPVQTRGVGSRPDKEYKPSVVGGNAREGQVLTSS